MKHNTTGPGQCWQDLQSAANRLQQKSITDLFVDNRQRASSMQLRAAGLVLDYSKNAIDRGALDLLQALFEECDVAHRLADQLDGENVNNTEDRPALHTAIRAAANNETSPEQAMIAAGQGLAADFAQSLYLGQRRGAGGEVIRDVVNLGIGGSDLGPRMATAALSHYIGGKTRVHFVSSLDDSELNDTLGALDPQSTLFLVSSKSFSTEETLFNARLAIDWFCRQRPRSEIAAHFAAITGSADAAIALGIDPEMIFMVPDWVGGRYSLWSSSGLALMIAVGADNFREFLKGGWLMDQHARNSDFHSNMPAILAALEIWHRNILDYSSLAVIPYSHELRLLPSYLQQLIMESNGKCVTRAGDPLQHSTSPLIWGTAGTEGQHSYHQLLHQGTDIIPVDFILPLGPGGPSAEAETRLASHCLAQSKALMEGVSRQAAEQEMLEQGLDDAEAGRLAPHKAMPGNRPSNTLVLEGLNPRTLGALIALYEHKTFLTSAIWDINPFDQWGVELGKKLSQAIFPVLDGSSKQQFDPSTNALMALFSAYRQKQT